VALGLKKMLNILHYTKEIYAETEIEIILYTEKFQSSGMHRLEEF
jgi:hypothetical protein